MRNQQAGIQICALANTVDAVEVMSLSYVLPQLSDRYEAWVQGSLSASVFGGMLLGGLVGGGLGDRIGRRKIMIASMILNASFTLVFSVATNANALVALRFLTGFGIGAAVPVLFCLAAELSPAQVRGTIISFVASFWVVGSVCAALAAWLVIPRLGWRWYVVVTAIPALVCSAISLRYLQVCLPGPSYPTPPPFISHLPSGGYRSLERRTHAAGPATSLASPPYTHAHARASSLSRTHMHSGSARAGPRK